MEFVLPVLQIDDYESAVEFYVNGLGFEIRMEHRHEAGFPVFMIIASGRLLLGLSEHGRGHSGSEVYVYVDDIGAWHQRCLDHGITPTQPPEPKPWGNTEMLVTDPSRNSLRFSQERTHPSTVSPNPA